MSGDGHHSWEVDAGVRPRTLLVNVAEVIKIMKTISGRYHAAKLLCTVCKRVESRVQGSKNFSPAFLEGSTNLRT